jgi:hypothetical protein
VMQIGTAGKRLDDLVGGLSRLNPLRPGR